MARGTGNKRGPRQTFQPARQPQPQQQNPQYQQPIMIPHLQQPQPNIIQQQYHQVPGPTVGIRGQQQIMIQQVQMPVRMQQQQQAQLQQSAPQPQQQQQPQGPQQYYRLPNQQTIPTSPSQMIVQPGQVPIRMQQQQQFQQITIQQSLPTGPSQPMMTQQVQIPARIQQHSGVRKQMVAVNTWNQAPSPQQQQQQQQQTQQQRQQQQQQQLIHQQQQQPQMVQVGNKRRAQDPNLMQNTFILTEQSLKESLISTLERNMNKHFFSHTLHRTFGPAVAQIIQ